MNGPPGRFRVAARRSWRSRAVDRAADLLSALLELGRGHKRAIIITADTLACAVAVWLAFALRLGHLHVFTMPMLAVMIVALGMWFPISYLRGIYKAIFRFSGLRTMIDLTVAAGIFTVSMVAVFLFYGQPDVPRSIGALQPLIFLYFLLTSRVVAHYLLINLLNQHEFKGTSERVAIYGAGAAGRQLAMALHFDPRMKLCAYIDDDQRLDGHRLEGVRVYHSDRLSELMDRTGVGTVALAIPSVSPERRKYIVDSLQRYQVRVLMLPSLQELDEGNVSVTDLREVQVEDLLGRDPVPPDALLLSLTTTGKAVLVTGAGGSIGSELCRQIAMLQPAVLILAEMTEHALYTIDIELRDGQADGSIPRSVRIIPKLVDVTDPNAMRRLYARHRPDTVFHAAAYKHVPMIEANIVAGVKNNVIGTLNTAQLAIEAGVAHFILVSTDKAVRPTNVMGATKRASELILQGLARQGGDTSFAMVRFGNVLGSSGSVVPRFKQQIREGGPVTLTHRDVTRYFMTIPEAAQLVIQAGAMAQGGEVYVLDMGNAVRVMDMARSMIELSGLTVRDAGNPDGDIEIVEIGLRPGEKLYEELLIDHDPEPTRHPRIMKAREKCLPWDQLNDLLVELRETLTQGDADAAVGLLSRIVEEYPGPRAADQGLGARLSGLGA